MRVSYKDIAPLAPVRTISCGRVVAVKDAVFADETSTPDEPRTFFFWYDVRSRQMTGGFIMEQEQSARDRREHRMGFLSWVFFVQNIAPGIPSLNRMLRCRGGGNGWRMGAVHGGFMNMRTRKVAQPPFDRISVKGDRYGDNLSGLRYPGRIPGRA
jgi:hypothetical protein